MPDTLHHETLNETLTNADVGIIGLGYVGLTLAIAMATAGIKVIGCDSNPVVSDMLHQGKIPFFEPGLLEGLQQQLGKHFAVASELPTTLPPTVIICVGTPLYEGTHTPNLQYLEAAIDAVSTRLQPDTLVVIRSTVSVGTSRTVVQTLQERFEFEPLLAFCPERTIQGKALEELHTLPQIVGGINPLASERAQAVFAQLTSYVNHVSSLEAAEMIKLMCNSHTDLIYGFGNQVALIAEALGLNAEELIRSANLNYPRPDLIGPGFVGGSCLSKDPYLLIHSTKERNYFPTLVHAARSHNESIPSHVGQRVLEMLQALQVNLPEAKICIAGFAYKGKPETDDLRGAPTAPILAIFSSRVRLIAGQDFVVDPSRLTALGVEPLYLEQAVDEASAVFVLNNHPKYRDYDLGELTARMRHPGVFFDAWGVFAEQECSCHPAVRYMRLGRG